MCCSRLPGRARHGLTQHFVQIPWIDERKLPPQPRLTKLGMRVIFDPAGSDERAARCNTCSVKTQSFHAVDAKQLGPYSAACVHVQFPFAEPVWDEFIESYGVKSAVMMLVRFFYSQHSDSEFAFNRRYRTKQQLVCLCRTPLWAQHAAVLAKTLHRILISVLLVYKGALRKKISLKRVNRGAAAMHSMRKVIAKMEIRTKS